MDGKHPAASKQLWFAAVLAALGAVQLQMPDLAIPAQYQGYATMALAAAIAFLRVITTQPVTTKEDA